MAWPFALMIDPAAPDDIRTDFSATFTPFDPGAAALPVGELSAQRGDGVFESLGVVDGHAQEVDAHLRRLSHSAALCDLASPNLAQWRTAVAVAEAHSPAGESVIKLILSRGVDHTPGPTAWLTAASTPDFHDARESGIRVVTLDRGIDSAAADRAPWLLLGAKTLSYAINMAAIREAKRRGADDAIFVSTDGNVLEAPTASVVLRVADRFITPPPSGAILHGTTQLSVFAYLQSRGHDVAYETVPASLLPTVDAAWLLSSLRLAAPIISVDDRLVPHDAPLTAELNAYLLSRRD